MNEIADEQNALNASPRHSILVFVLGLVSLVCCGALTGIPGVILGRKALRAAKESDGSNNTGLLRAGFVLSIVGTVGSLLFVGAIALDQATGCTWTCISMVKVDGQTYTNVPVGSLPAVVAAADAKLRKAQQTYIEATHPLVEDYKQLQAATTVGQFVEACAAYAQDEAKANATLSTYDWPADAKQPINELVAKATAERAHYLDCAAAHTDAAANAAVNAAEALDTASAAQAAATALGLATAPTS